MSISLKKGMKVLLSAVLLLIMVFSSADVWADGSADMYPSGATGTYRATLIGGLITDERKSSCPYSNNGTIKVYAKPGEKICVATSAFARNGAHIDWRSPDGTSGTFTKSGTTGYIQNRTQELAGPDLNGTGNCYVPFTIPVGDKQEGVWEIDFNTGSTSYEDNGEKLNDWSESSTSCEIHAWDVSVLDNNNNWIHGRVYVNVLNLHVYSGGDLGFGPEWYSTFYILTNSGFLYKMQTNGMNPCLASFFANNRGVQDATNYTQTTTSSYVSGGKATYKSIPTPDVTQLPVYDPRLQDNILSTQAADGSWVDYYLDVTHKIFFRTPALDMPAKTRCVYGNTVDSTWLINKDSRKSEPKLTNLQLVGAEGLSPGIMGPEGLMISFNSNAQGEYTITMTFTDTQYKTRVLTGNAVEGDNYIKWDGLDGEGKEVPDVSVLLSGTIKSAEVHFPFTDLDNNKNGFYLQQLSSDWSTVIRDKMYWDDSNVSYTTLNTGDDPLVSTDGQASPSHKFTFVSINRNNGNSRGNDAILDTWTYAEGTTDNALVSTARKRFIDLAITSAKCNKTKAHVGEEIIYTLNVSNLNKTGIEFNGQTVDVDADADSASVGVWFPDGGFYTTEVKLVSSDDPDCKVIQQPSGDEYGLGFITLKNGKSAVVTVKGYASAKLAHKTLQPQGFIMRPGDYYEIDANNITTDGMPLIPSNEYTGDKQNNMLQTPKLLFILNSAPVAHSDVVETYSGETVTSNVLVNDADADNDAMAVYSYYVVAGTNLTAGNSVDVYNGDTKCGTFTVNGDNSYTFTAAEKFMGIVPNIYYVATDQYAGNGTEYDAVDLLPGLDTSFISIKVTDHAPEIEVKSDKITINSGSKVLLPISFYDEDGNHITTTLSGESSDFTVEDGKVYYTGGGINPPSTDKVYNLSVTSTDGIIPVTENLEVTVLSNHAPTFSRTEVTVNTSVGTSLTGILPIVIKDPDGDPVTISISGTDASHFTVDGNIINYNVERKGSYTIEVTATDDKGASTVQTVKVTSQLQYQNSTTLNVTTNNIVYGTPLSSGYSKNTGYITLKGDLVVKEDGLILNEDKILSAGQHDLTFLFLPTDPGYAAESKTATVTVTARPITLKSGTSEKIYDGEELRNKTVEITSGSLVGTDGFYYTNFASITDVGETHNSFEVNAIENTLLSNYSITQEPGTLTVTVNNVSEDGMTIELPSTSVEYNGQAQMPEVTVKVNGKVIPATEYKVTYSHNFNVGTATVTVTDIEGGNCYIPTKSSTFTITPRTVSLNWSADELSYTGTEQTVTATVANALSADEVNVSEYTDNAKTNIGTYTAKATALDNSNYIIASTSASHNWSITSKEVSADDYTIEVSNVTYDGTAQEAAVTVKVDGVVVDPSEYELTYTNNANAGTATVTVSDKADGAYEFESKSANFTINKREVELDWGTTSFTYDGKAKSVSATVTNAAIAGEVTVTEYKDNTATSVGTYTAKATKLNNDNYMIASDDSTQSWNIIAKSGTVTVLLDNTSLVYNGAEQKPTVTVKMGDVVIPSTEYEVSYSNNKDAGTATVTVKDKTGGNYTFSDVTTNFTITKKNVVLDWGTTTYTYDGSKKIVTANVTNAVSGETVTVSGYKDNEKTAAGEYTAKATGISDTKNYQIAASDSTQAWSITSKSGTVTVTVDNTPLTYNGSEHKPDVTVKMGDVVIPDTEYEVSYSNNKDAGTATVTVTDKTGGNYTVATTSANFAIAKKNVALNWGTTAYTYDGTKKTVTATVTNAVSGETVTVSGYKDNEKTAAGEYTAKATGLSNTTNYQIAASDSTTKWTIAAKTGTVTLTVDDTPLTYNGSEQKPAVTVKIGDVVIPDTEYEVSYSSNKNAGTATVTVTDKAGGNYTVATTSTNFTIAQKEVELNWGTTTYTYDGTKKTVSATVNNAESGDAVTVTGYTNNEGTDAKTYTAKATGISNANYKIATDDSTQAWSITAKSVAAADYTITVDNATYDGTAKTPTVTVKIGDKVIDASEYDVTYADNTNAGTAKVTITDKANGNYTFASKSADFTINKRDVVLDWGTTAYTYDGSKQTVSATVTNTVGSDVVTVTGYTNNEATAAGTYTAKATTLSNTNYQISESVASKSWSIAPKTVVLAWTESALTYDGSEQSITATVSNSVNGDAVTVDTYTGNKATAVGTYTAKATKLSNSNYQIGENDSTKAWSITAATGNVVVTVDNSTAFIYDGNEKKPAVTVKVGGVVVPEDEYTVTYTDNKDAGTATVTVTDNAGGSYSFAKTTANFTIAPKTVTLKWTDNSFTYDGEQKSITATVDNPVGTETVTVTGYKTNQATNAGDYTAKATGLSSKNYQIGKSDSTKSWSISSKTVALTWTDNTLTYNGSEQSITATVSNAVKESDVTVETYTGNKATAVGNYTAKATKLSNANYQIAKNDSTQAWSIAAATGTVTVTVDNSTAFTYDGKEKKPAVTVKIGDVVIPATEYEVSYSNNTNAGTATVTVKDVEGGNYTVAETSANFTIAKKDVVLDWGTTTYTYDGTKKTVSATVSNPVGTDEVNVTGYTNNEKTEVGKYTAKATGIDNANYQIAASDSTKDWSITSKSGTVTVTVDNTALTYNGAEQKPAVTVKIGDVVIPESEYTVTYSGNKDAGTAKVTITDKEGGNYTVAETSANFTIAKRNVELDWGATTYTYDGSKKTVSATVKNAVEGETVTVTGYKENEKTVVGEYTAKATGLSNIKNYQIAASDSTKDWSITSKSGTVTVTVDNTALTYNGSEQKPAVTVKMGDVVLPDTEYEVSYSNNTDAGSATVTVTDKEGGNYTIAEASANFIIAKRNVELDWGTTTYTYDGDKKSVSATVKNVVEGESVTVTSYKNNEKTEAGEYEAKATGLSNTTNYQIAASDSTKKWNITAKTGTVTLTVDNTALTYNGAEQKPSVTVKIGDDVIPSSEYTVTYTDNKDAGTAKVTVTDKEGGNYTVAETSANFTIAKRNVELDWGTTTYTYDGSKKSVSATVKNAVAGETVTVTGYKNNEKTETGEYEAKATGLSNTTNYQIATSDSTQKWSITAKTGTVTVAVDNSTALTYNGSEQKPAVTVKMGDIVIPDDEYDEVYANNKNAGTATVTVKAKENGNYSFNAVTENFTIAKRNVELDWGTTTFTYDGSKQTVSATVTNAVSGETVTVTGYKNNEAIETGKYTAKATGISNTDNYQIASKDSTKEWNITAASGTVTLTLDKTSLTYDGTEQKPGVTVKIGDVVIDDDEYDVVYTDNKKAGTATVTVTPKTDGDYTFDKTTANFTITPKTVGVVWDNTTSYSYDGNEHSVTATLSGAVDGDPVAVKTYENNTATAVGNYTAKITALDNANYQLPTTGTTEAWAIVSPSGEVTIELGNDTLTYNGKAQYTTVTVKMGGVAISGDEFTLVYTNNKNVGKATITVKDKDGGNYTIPQTSTTLVIAPKEVELVWDYDTYTYNGKSRSVSAKVNNAISGDVVTVMSYTGQSAINAGSYTAKAVTLNNKNYAIAADDSLHNWTITPAEGEMTVTVGAVTYNGEAQTPTVTVAVDGVTIASKEYTLTYADNVNAGTGKVTVKDVDGGNYILTDQTVDFTINKRTAELSWTTDEFTYDGTEKSITATVSNAAKEGDVKVLTYANNTAKMVGSYTAKALTLDNDNYELPSDATHSWNIKSATGTQKVTLSTEALTYDGKEQKPTVTIKIGDKVVDPTEYDVTYSDNVNAGVATVTISDIAGGNYDVEATSVNFTINPLPVELKWSESAFTYDGTKKGVSAKVENAIGTDEVKVVTYLNDSATVVGEYEAKVTKLSNSNYSIGAKDSTLKWTISAKELFADDYSIELSSTELTYNGEAQQPTVTIKAGDKIIPATEYTVTYSDNKNAGEATVTITDKDGGNYIIAKNTATFTIAPKDVKLDWGTTELTYNGKQQNVSANITNVVSGDVVEVSKYAGDTATKAGDYTAKAVALSNANYSIAAADSLKSWTIVPEAIPATGYTIDIDDAVLTYNGKALQPAVTVKIGDQVISADEYTVTYTDNIHAGTATVTITDKEGGNYTFATSTNKFKISPKTAELEWTKTDFTYDGDEHKVTASIKNAEDGDDVEVSTYAGNTATSAGKYTAKAMGLTNADYAIASTDTAKSWSIAAQSVTPDVELSSESLVYNGKEQTPTVTIKIGDKVIPSSEYTVTYSDNKNAGEATITITDKDGGNYTIAKEVKTFTIVPKDVELDWGTTALTYNGKEQEVSAKVVNAIGEDKVEVSKYTDNAATAVGDYTAKATALSNANYRIASSDSTADWSIKAKSVKSTDYSIEIGESAITYNGKAQTPEVTLKVGDEVIPESEYTVTYNNNVNAGEATITITDKDGGNYIIAEGTTSFTIAPVDVKLDWGTTTLTYNGEEQSVSAKVINAVGDDKVEVSSYASNKATSAGDYTAKVKGLSNANYRIASSDSLVEWSIKPQTIKASDYAIVIDDTPLTYSGDSLKPSVSIKIGDKIISADEYTVTYSDNVHAGEAKVTISDKDGGNYTFETASDDFKIGQLTAELEWSKSEYTYDGEEHEVTASIKNAAEGDKVEVSAYTDNTAKSAGDYTAKAMGLTNADYAIASDDSTKAWSIAVLNGTPVIEMDDESLVYNGEELKPTVTVKIGDQVIPATEYTVTYTDNKNAGEATITITDKDGGNYSFTETTTKFTIEPKDVKLEWGSTELTFNGEEQQVSAKVTNAVGDDEVEVSSLTGNKATATGEYTAKITGLSNSNYRIAAGDSTKEWSINAKKVSADDYTIELGESAITYNGKEQKPEVTIKIGDEVIPTSEYTVTYSDNTHAGEATITITDKDGGNYAFETSTINFEIAPKTVELEWSNTDIAYDGDKHEVTASVKNAEEGDEVEIDGYTDNTATKVGEYTAKINGLTNTDYAIASDDSTKVWSIAELSGKPVIVLDEESLVYNGEELKPAVTVKIGDTVIPADEYEVVYDDNKNAGEATLTIKDKDGGNFDFGDTAVHFTIKPIELSVEFADTTFTFDGKQKQITYSLDGVLDGDKVNIEIAGDTATKAGEYTVEVKGVDNSNYTIADTSFNWTISKSEYKMPDLTPIAESVAGANDGHIEGLEKGMQIKKEGEKEFTEVTDPDMKLEPGTYEIRMPEQENYESSEVITLAIESGAIPFVIDSIVVKDFGYCPETDDAIRYYVKGESNPEEYRILFSDDAKDAGFEDIDFTDITENGVLPVNIPDCKPGTYKAQIQFRSNSSESRLYDVEFNVNLSTKYMVDIWTDVVSAVNVENIFEEYQWFHNDEKLEGETKPFYCEKNGLTGSYYMEVVTVDDEHLRTCKLYFGEPKIEITLSAYPNPTRDYATIELSYDNGDAHLLKVFNSAGGAVLTTTFTGAKTVVNFANLPAANYVVNVDGVDVKVIKE